MLEKQGNRQQNRILWCAGLPLVGERRLERLEQEQLRQVAWRLLWQGLGAFLGIAVLGIGLIAGAAELDKYWGGSLVVITVVFIALLLSLPATLFARQGWTQRGLLTFRDLRRGYVRVFEGELMEADLLKTEEAADATQSSLISLGLLTVGSPEPQTIEVLPVSRRVWRVNGEATMPWIEANWKEVTSAPEAASPWLHTNSALTSGPRTFDDTEHRRRLSDRERAELKRETRRHWLGAFVAALLMTAWLSTIVVVAFTTGGVPKVASWWGMIHIVLATFTADTFFLSRWAQARKLYQDIRGGEVLVEFESGSPAGNQPALPAETLPNSGRLWTKAGRPAAWRRIRR